MREYRRRDNSGVYLLKTDLVQVLKTVTSVLHMLRCNSQSMSFQVLQYTVAPSLRDQHGRSHFTRGGARQENTTELPDGCGSLVLVDVQVPLDRAMIFCIRPPWLIGKRELMDFVQATVSCCVLLCIVQV
jgi:hypothetical protein